MSLDRNLDVSVVLPFEDDEDFVGTVVQQVAALLHARGLRFEILAVDQDSGDNSHAVLALVRSSHPLLQDALQILQAGSCDRGYEHGARHARGRALWLVEPRSAADALASFEHAYQQVSRGERDVVVRGERFTVAHRLRSASVIDGLRGTGSRFHHRLARRARERGLSVSAGQRMSPRAPRPLQRIMAALSHVLSF